LSSTSSRQVCQEDAVRAYEVAKDKSFPIGRVMMCIEGDKAAIPKIEAILRKDFGACDYQEVGQKEGEIATFFVIARSEKAEFMKNWKAAKAGI